MDLYNIVNKNAIDFINNNSITMTYTVRQQKRIVTLIQNNIEIGYFYIEGTNVDTVDMSIYIDDNPQLRGKGLAKLMIGYMILNINLSKDQLIFIDADASVGFWDYIGMQENRYYERNNRNVIGKGYEKVITYSNLIKWALGVKV